MKIRDIILLEKIPIEKVTFLIGWSMMFFILLDLENHIMMFKIGKRDRYGIAASYRKTGCDCGE